MINPKIGDTVEYVGERSEEKEPKKFTVLIDDNRDTCCDLVARNSQAGQFLLKNLQGQIEDLYLDYDLGFESETNGLGILEWAIKNGLLPDIVILCSGFPSGREAMGDFLSNNGYVSHSPNHWEKQTSKIRREKHNE